MMVMYCKHKGHGAKFGSPWEAISAVRRGLETVNPTAESFYIQKKQSVSCCERELPVEGNPL